MGYRNRPESDTDQFNIYWEGPSPKRMALKLADGAVVEIDMHPGSLVRISPNGREFEIEFLDLDEPYAGLRVVR